MTHHFILTRFNVWIWGRDKSGHAIERNEWLRERLRLFETYCLPSVVGQTEDNFVWVMLVDEDTPDEFRGRIMRYRGQCSQIRVVKVRRGCGEYFARVFQQVVGKALKECGAEPGDLCLTTYLDNDDSIRRDFAADVRRRCEAFRLEPGHDSFLSFDYGLQVFQQLGNLTTRIAYPNNHFITLAECLSEEAMSADERMAKVRTCYGYGSHFLLERRGLARVEHVKDKRNPMWAEVVHQGNVDNDVKMTLQTSFVADMEILHRDFSLDVDISKGNRRRFLWRAIGQMWRRLKDKAFCPH